MCRHSDYSVVPGCTCFCHHDIPRCRWDCGVVAVTISPFYWMGRKSSKIWLLSLLLLLLLLLLLFFIFFLVVIAFDIISSTFFFINQFIYLFICIYSFIYSYVHLNAHVMHSWHSCVHQRILLITETDLELISLHGFLLPLSCIYFTNHSLILCCLIINLLFFSYH